MCPKNEFLSIPFSFFSLFSCVKLTPDSVAREIPAVAVAVVAVVFVVAVAVMAVAVLSFCSRCCCVFLMGYLYPCLLP